MKNWKIYMYLLFTYILMHVGSVFLAQGLFENFPWNEQYTEQDMQVPGEFLVAFHR